MKALIISDDKELVKFYNDIFKENKVDTINYSWLLKAMDNVEEIRPDFIVIDSVEYPRHWKTLVQYVNSNVFNCSVYFILQVNDSFSEDENKKAECLGINSIVSSFSDYFKKKIIVQIKEFINNLTETPAESKQEEDSLSESQPEETTPSEEITPAEETTTSEETTPSEETTASEETLKDSDDELFSVDKIINKSKKKKADFAGSYLITNPITGKVIYGKYLEYDGRKITCKIDNIDDFSGIENKTFVKYVTFCNKKECKSFSAEANEYLELAEQKFLVLDICDFYEEK